MQAYIYIFFSPMDPIGYRYQFTCSSAIRSHLRPFSDTAPANSRKPGWSPERCFGCHFLHLSFDVSGCPRLGYGSGMVFPLQKRECWVPYKPQKGMKIVEKEGSYTRNIVGKSPLCRN